MPPSQNVANAIISRAEARLEGIGPKRVFCLTPNVGSISFVSQQVRALNLVWALLANEHIKAAQRVAVIGGGLSGITTSFALRAYGCKVELFDEHDEPITVQRLTLHRHVHPSLNRWPHHSPLLPTTDFPFLNWYFGQCNNVVDGQTGFTPDYKTFKTKSGPDFQFRGGKKIISISSNTLSNTLTITDNKAGVHQSFDAVIISTGFGSERSHLDIPAKSYWRPDGLEELKRDKIKNPDFKTFIVSGAGDGGQIDALRIAFAFRFGELTFRTAEALVGSEIETKIKEIEAVQGANNWHHKCRGYEDLVKSVATEKPYSDLNAFLSDKIEKRPKLVTLIDSVLDSPYAGNAAPIHKLLVAYAIAVGTLVFKPGTLTKSVIENAYELNGDTFERSNAEFIIRHGSEPHPIELIPEGEWKRLRAAQENSKDYNFQPAWPAEVPYPVPTGFRCRVTETAKYISECRVAAKRAMSKLDPNCHVAERPKEFKVSDYTLIYQPKTLFGIPVDYGPPDSSTLL